MARGLVGYGAKELQPLVGHRLDDLTSRISPRGRGPGRTVVRRDDLVVL
ncbi:hypothetical protein [Ornithinimicrobium sp. INDO-MA30-4]|nr:hypothetical protein [Ornithinimicrobium sp. INDO-MA30-4]